MALSSSAITGFVEYADISISEQGIAWYWGLTGIFSFCAVAFLAGSFVVRHPNVRLLYYLSALSCYVLSMTYFAMGANIGWVAVEVEFARDSQFVINSGLDNPTRQIFWIRYAGWLLATPIIMTELLLLINAPLTLILHNIFMVGIVMMTGLGGALIPTAYKWAYYVYGAFACVAIAWIILKTGYNHVRSTAPALKQMYIMSGVFLSVSWPLYGACWGLGEGGNVISPTSEAVFYGILDVWAGPLYCAFLLWTAHRFYKTGSLGVPV